MSNDNDRRIASLTAALEQANSTLRGKMDELSLVRRVGDAISHHTSIWSLSSELVDAIAETINCKYAVIYSEPASNTATFELQAVSSIFSGPENFPPALRQSRLVRYLEQRGSPVQITDLNDDPVWSEAWPLPPGLASWLCVPLLTRSRLRGMLCLADDAPCAFDERTLRTLMIVVPQISSAFSNIGLYSHLRQSEAKYRMLVSGMQDIVYICDRQWQIIEANPAADPVFGGPIVGRTLTELFASPNTASQFVETVRTSRAVQNFETELLNTQHERIVALLSCVTDGDHYSGIIKDMTERTRLMEQVTHSQKMESVGILASGVAHDFNNILGIILPNAEMIKMKINPDSSAAGYADVIINASRHAGQLTRQLLSLSRKDPVSLRVINLNDAIRTTGKLLGETIDRKIRLEYDLTGECTNIKADETQIQQVLLNLAINARDAMPDGGVLKYSTRCEGTDVVVRVADTGTGIEREMLSKIFDPFFTTKDKSKGTGLGLSVVYGIVKQTGGSIDVRSEVGTGTEFIIRFPSSSEVRRRAARKAIRPAGGSEKILVADDEPELLRLLESNLTELGYSVICARNGIEAMEYLQDDVRLVILDMIMPEMDRVATLRRIREKTPDVKVLVASGHTSPEKNPLLDDLGIDGFVQKPFELARLAGAVRDVLDGVAV
ncbi:MAG TPA: ATP-binding protein [Terriglobia bacterium]|jgi:signal transduction histidine kinase/CheY-like chemotaxis protein